MLDRATVAHIAELAKLGLSEGELASLGAQLAHILDYVAQLAEAPIGSLDDVTGGGGGPAAARLRADVSAPSLSREAVLALAPDTEAGYVRVPPLLD